MEKHLKENIVLHVYLKANYPENELKQFEKEYLFKDFIKSFDFKSPETSLREAKESIGEDLVSELDSNPFNPNYEVYLNANSSSQDRIAHAETSIKASNMVEEISFPKNIADLIEERFATIAPILLFLCIILAIVAITLINHNVKLNIFSQRFLIKSMQMVGATKAFIIKPFLKRAVINGVLAGVFSSLLIFNTAYFALYYVPDLRAVLPDFRTDINITLLLILFVVLSLCGVLVSTICTWTATRRYLKTQIDELY
ncbi:MAG: permease-like cell division protein FtsX [Bacteroidota bacterium]|nr:permease-like cell division protein FtsX [Bacteroidota bacterium]